MTDNITQRLIQRFKRMRTNAVLADTCRYSYAFVGMGGHSMNNLYPVLDYLRVPLKYICVTSPHKAQLIERKYPGIRAVTSLDDVLSDGDVRGVFVATAPTAHFGIARRILQSGKSLFIEKPPCGSLDELETLIRLQEQHGSVVTAGLQKLYAPCTAILKKRLRREQVISYSFRYLTGAYPEGNALLDLFIHPIDLATYLFGEAEIKACEQVADGSFMIILKHGVTTGTLELSTCYSWSSAKEELTVCTKSGIYEMRQMEELTYTPKMRSFCNIPLEKVLPASHSVEYLYSRNNFSPLLANNQIHSQGFYSEIREFVRAVESGKTETASSFHKLRATYNILDKITSLTP